MHTKLFCPKRASQSGGSGSLFRIRLYDDSSKMSVPAGQSGGVTDDEFQEFDLEGLLCWWRALSLRVWHLILDPHLILGLVVRMGPKAGVTRERLRMGVSVGRREA